LRPFIRETLWDQDVVADFFNVTLRGAAFSLEQADIANEALTLEEIAGMRVVQTVLNKRKVPAFLRLSVGGAIGHELAEVSGRSRNKLTLNSKHAAKILAAYHADAKAIDARFFDGTPMEQALSDAVGKAAQTAPSADASAYFQPDTIARLRRLSVELAKLLKDNPLAWRRSYQLQIGQAHDGDFNSPTKAQQQNTTAVWENLQKITLILATGRASAGANPKG
jgi:hypothetical protein